MRALLVVEPHFLREHVGVRRVILYWWKRFASAGYSVILATPNANSLLIGEAPVLESLLAPPLGDDTPTWKSSSGLMPHIVETPSRTTREVVWTSERADPADFDVSVLTNPWLCQLGLPKANFTIGIVYDLVPNFIAAGCLRFPHADDVWALAKAHDAGFRTFRESCERIVCISDSTRRDFESLYPETKAAQKCLVAFPFSDDAIDAPSAIALSDNRTVLLVNALDPRKNPRGMAAAIAGATAASPISAVVVGRERMPMKDALDILGTLADANVEVTWYRAASDYLLDRLYRNSSVLLFNSFYEGLGLPILEAQARGLAAISSNTSSCREINLNPALTVDCFERADLTERLLDALDNRIPVLRGEKLRAAQKEFLSGRNNLNQLLGSTIAA